MDVSQQEKKFRGLCLNTSIGILICCIFTFSVRWLKLKGRLDQMQWDMKTVTAGDYTVELKISEADYRAWYDSEYKGPAGDF
jgi:hypothetical protein